MNTPSNYVGQPIRSLQTMLRTLAHADETLLKLVPDGIYGPNTVQAVREFQRQNDLSPQWLALMKTLGRRIFVDLDICSHCLQRKMVF